MIDTASLLGELAVYENERKQRRMSGNIPFVHKRKTHTLSITEMSDDDPAKEHDCPRAVLTLHGLTGDSTFFGQLVRARGGGAETVQHHNGKRGVQYTFLTPSQIRQSSDPQWLAEEIDAFVEHLQKRSKWRVSGARFLIFNIPQRAAYVTLRGYTTKAKVEQVQARLTQALRTSGVIDKGGSIACASTEDCTFRIPPLNTAMVKALEKDLVDITS